MVLEEEISYGKVNTNLNKAKTFTYELQINKTSNIKQKTSKDKGKIWPLSPPTHTILLNLSRFIINHSQFSL